MDKYIKTTVEAFFNQAFDKEGYEHFKNESFWEMVAKEYFPDEDKEGDSWKSTVEDLMLKEHKYVNVNVNGKKVGYIYLHPETDYNTTVEYALNQVDLSLEEMQKYPVFKISLKLNSIVPWEGKDRSNVSIVYSDKEKVENKSPKVKREETLEREKKSEKEWQKKFVSKFGKVDLPEGLTWADFYEMKKVSQDPKDGIQLGAMVDAVIRGTKDDVDEYYGYITGIKYNTKDRPIELTIKKFGKGKQIWIWHGTASNGTWLQKTAYEKLKTEKKTIRTLKYKDLKINPDRFDLEFE